ncbi:MAG: shikimate kinase [Bacillus sp. (in: Bacteria)]|nr:shikimate kinase [Bacillus sp. (in: firmicutes)]
MKNIILIGFMGSGKSTVGIKLSYHLRRALEDTDKLIEKEEGRTISKIFRDDGEPYFRNLETECLKKLIQTTDDKIISVGGGLPMRKENHELLKKLGTVVYLRATPETIYERVKHDTSRPLLQGGNPQEKIRTLLRERTPIYEQAADFIVDVDNKDFEEILEEIAHTLEK